MTIRSFLSSGTVGIRDGHDNFFTPLRLFFAVLVMIGHSFAIVNGDPMSEPTVFFQYTPSYLAVNLFFIASGFLVTGSMMVRRASAPFASARLLRIYPALIVHVLFLMFILGPLATEWPLVDYLRDPQLWAQPAMILSFFNTDAFLPGAFLGNGEQYASLPLWTLRYEILCYAATLSLFLLGLMRHRWMIVMQFVLPCLAWLVGQRLGLFDALPATVENMARFGMAYGLGAVIFAYRESLRVNWLVVPLLVGACFLLQNSLLMEIAVNLLLAAVILLLAYMRAPSLEPLKRLPDLSYGIYIYHWGIMQLAFQWKPDLSIVSLFIVALPVTVGLAWLSWVVVEKPALRLKGSLAERLTFRRTAEADPA